MANAVKFNGIIFDDFEKEEEDTFLYTDQNGNKVESEQEGVHYWSEICEHHAKKFIKSKQIDENMLDRNAAGGICSVCGCNRSADHYIDFPAIVEEINI
jgi:hypothetical protein